MVNDAACTMNPYSMAWNFPCHLFLSVCGLINITLRSAFFPVKVVEDGGVTYNHADAFQEGAYYSSRLT